MQTVRQFVERFPITVVDLDTEIAVIAAQLRATHKTLRLPDALVVATARHGSADVLITTDHRWPTAKAIGLAGSIRRL